MKQTRNIRVHELLSFFLLWKWLQVWLASIFRRAGKEHCSLSSAAVWLTPISKLLAKICTWHLLLLFAKHSTFSSMVYIRNGQHICVLDKSWDRSHVSGNIDVLWKAIKCNLLVRPKRKILSIPFASASGLGPGLFASVCLPSFSGSTIRDGVWPTQGSSWVVQPLWKLTSLHSQHQRYIIPGRRSHDPQIGIGP